VPKEISSEAARIYVFERLSHHLVFHRFAAWHQVRYAMLLAAWLPLAWSLRKEANIWGLQLVAGGAVAIGAAGVLIDQSFVMLSQSQNWTPAEFQLQAAPLLRYYWFRMSDALVPVAVALAATWWIARLRPARPQMGNWLLILAILAATANVVDVGYWRSRLPLPGAILQPRPTADSGYRWWFETGLIEAEQPGAVTADEWTRDWKAVCHWIESNTPEDARFITPRYQQTFKWYAQRAEVANWKDVPQDAVSVAQWKQALDTLYPRDRRHHREDLAAESDENLAMLGRYFQAHYIVIDRTRSRRPIGLPRVYPPMREDNPSFAVYRVPELQP
jgi:hypothetical protein